MKMLVNDSILNAFVKTTEILIYEHIVTISYINEQVLHNQFSPFFLCRVSWLTIITNLGSLSQIGLIDYQLKSISFNYKCTV